jgi:hypothetical protein
MSSASAFAAGCLPNVTSKLSDAAKFAATQKTGGYSLNRWLQFKYVGHLCR